jgi:hypothetical protein
MPLDEVLQSGIGRNQSACPRIEAVGHFVWGNRT